MTNRILIWLVAVFFLTTVSFAEAQQPAKLRRIGYLAAAKGPSPYFEAFKHGLRDLGYGEGQNLAIVFRASEDLNQIAALAAELVQQKVSRSLWRKAQPPYERHDWRPHPYPLCLVLAVTRLKPVLSRAWRGRAAILRV